MIRWKRSEDGGTESHCGEWSIEAKYNHGTRPYAYNVHGPGSLYNFDTAYTVKDAKAKCERMFARLVKLQNQEA